jgi:hypothetical protein
VLFAPKNVGEGIGYTIFISKYDPTSLVNTPPEPTGIDANPSPPKEW